jgi:hypothetical protein
VRRPRVLDFRRGELVEDALDVHQLLAVYAANWAGGISFS